MRRSPHALNHFSRTLECAANSAASNRFLKHCTKHVKTPASSMTAHCILGIDPGLTGACAFFFSSAPARVAAENMPVVAGEVDCATLAARIIQIGPAFAVVERVASMPKQGVASTFKFGASYGAVRGVLAALQIRTHLVAPAVWKKHFRLDSEKEKGIAPVRCEPATFQRQAGS